MIHHLPLYRSNKTGREVRAGRIKRVVGARVNVSTAPVGQEASLSTGFPHIPIDLDAETTARVGIKLALGDVLVIGDVLTVWTEQPDSFLAVYHPVGEIKPPVF